MNINREELWFSSFNLEEVSSARRTCYISICISRADPVRAERAESFLSFLSKMGMYDGRTWQRIDVLQWSLMIEKASRREIERKRRGEECVGAQSTDSREKGSEHWMDLLVFCTKRIRVLFEIIRVLQKSKTLLCNQWISWNGIYVQNQVLKSSEVIWCLSAQLGMDTNSIVMSRFQFLKQLSYIRFWWNISQKAICLCLVKG